jgi:hypothetical protein
MRRPIKFVLIIALCGVIFVVLAFLPKTFLSLTTAQDPQLLYPLWLRATFYGRRRGVPYLRLGVCGPTTI